MTRSLGFGDYSVLERIAQAPIRRDEHSHWTMKEMGLAAYSSGESRNDGMLYITEAGLKYLRKFKRPAFPRSKSYFVAQTFEFGDGI